MGISEARHDGLTEGAEPADVTGTLLELSLGYLYSAALQTVAKYRIADYLADGPRAPEELAGLAGVHGPHLRRLLRYLATRGVFREDPEGLFHLTPLADPLRAGAEKSLRDFVLVRGTEPFWRSAAQLSESVRTGSTAFDDLYGIPFYSHLAQNPELGSAFDTSMAAFSETLSDDVVESCDLASARTVVDVGGGRGGLLRAVLGRYPKATGVLFDLPSVVRDHVLDTPELAGRWEARGGDFFDSVPAGSDVYLLKHVLASWPDDDCLRILRACREALPEQGRVLVINALIPEGNAPHPGKTIDVMMMALLHGKGRTREEYEALITAAGLRVTRVVSASAHASVLEAVAAD